MAYSTVAEIQSDFQNLTFATDSLVKTAAVEGFIAEADALIDSYVGMKYTTPITADASAVLLMKLCSRTIVADRVKKIKEVKQLQNNSANQEVRGAFGTKDVMKILDQIKKGEIKLSGATPLVAAGGFYSENYANDVQPVFHKDCKEW